MNVVRFEESEVTATGTGYSLASCERYWVILGVSAGQPGYLFHWRGTGWTDGWDHMLLYDRPGALEVARGLSGVLAVVQAVNLADYLRFDRRVAGYPRHLAGKMRHAGSEEALRDIYQAVMREEA